MKPHQNHNHTFNLSPPMVRSDRISCHLQASKREGWSDIVSAASMGADVFRRGDGDDVVKKNNSDV
ncbi:hypothetical protein Hdeb2414_s0009g00319981 [Helianthus debilis subsp. tardiflorus]